MCLLCIVHSQTGYSAGRVAAVVHTHSIVGKSIIFVVLTRIPRIFYNHLVRTDPAPNHIRVILRRRIIARELYPWKGSKRKSDFSVIGVEQETSIELLHTKHFWIVQLMNDQMSLSPRVCTMLAQIYMKFSATNAFIMKVKLLFYRQIVWTWKINTVYNYYYYNSSI